MSRVKVLVLPSLCEAFSITTLESLCCGTPVIVTRTVPDILVRHGFNGFKIYDPYDHESLARYILKVTLDSNLWERMSAMGRRVCKYFDVKKIVDKLLAIYGL